MRVTWLLLILVAFSGEVARAQDAGVDTRAHEIYSAVMSPYCQGLLLADCPSPAAFTLRAEIRERLVAGESPADIEQSLYTKFGDGIRAVPRAGGWGLVLWVTPLIVFASSLAGLAWYLARMRTEDTAGPRLRLVTDPALEERLDEELQDL